MSTRKLASLLLTASAIFLPALSRGDSQVRIVRLSYIDGDVQIDRGDGRGFERAILNMPVTSGVRLRTGDDARAEIEFEKGSTIRVSPDTGVEFIELSRRESGQPATSVQLHYGTAYFNLRDKDAEGFSIEMARRAIRLQKSAQFRLQVEDVDATIAVYKGEVKVAEGTGDNWVAVGKSQTLTVDLDGMSHPIFAQEVAPNPDDQWDKERNQYREAFGSGSDLGYYGSSSDLNYYGRFIYVPPYGNLWRPGFVSAAWNPFADGTWVWYPGFGYTWVSGYPWGWTPYHYGSWLFVPSYGWCWNPRGLWWTWNNIPTVVDPPPGFNLPQPPPRGGPGVVVVGRGPNPVRVGGRRPILDDLEGSPGGLSGRRNGPPQGGSAASYGRSTAGASPGWMGTGRGARVPETGRSDAADSRAGRGPSDSSHAAPPAAPVSPGLGAPHGSMGGMGSSRPSGSSLGGSHGSFGGSHSSGSGSHSGHSSSPRSSGPR